MARKWKPTEKQQKLIDAIIDPLNGKSINKTLKSLGIPSSTYYKWKQNPDFAAHMNRLSRNIFKAYEPEVNKSFIDKARHGSFQHQKLYYEMIDRYQQKVQLTTLNQEIKDMTDAELAEYIANCEKAAQDDA